MYRCEAEIEAAREAGVKVIPCYSGDDYGATRSMLMRALCEPTALHPAHYPRMRPRALGCLGAYCWHGRVEAPERLWESRACDLHATHEAVGRCLVGKYCWRVLLCGGSCAMRGSGQRAPQYCSLGQQTEVAVRLW